MESETRTAAYMPQAVQERCYMEGCATVLAGERTFTMTTESGRVSLLWPVEARWESAALWVPSPLTFRFKRSKLFDPVDSIAMIDDSYEPLLVWPGAGLLGAHVLPGHRDVPVTWWGPVFSVTHG